MNRFTYLIFCKPIHLQICIKLKKWVVRSEGNELRMIVYIYDLQPPFQCTHKAESLIDYN
jgi:hypothetical protein